jgi:hypothetical protein
MSRRQLNPDRWVRHSVNTPRHSVISDSFFDAAAAESEQRNNAPMGLAETCAHDVAQNDEFEAVDSESAAS